MQTFSIGRIWSIYVHFVWILANAYEKRRHAISSDTRYSVVTLEQRCAIYVEENRPKSYCFSNSMGTDQQGSFQIALKRTFYY